MIVPAARKLILCTLSVAGLFASPPPGWAEAGGDRIEFQVQAEREIPNDLSRAVMRVDGAASDAAALAREINQTMAAALDIARGTPEVQTRTGDYRTWPEYEERKATRIVHWRASQTLVLESDEAPALLGLLGALQEQGVLLASLAHEPSATRRAEAETELVADAMRAFRQRASLLQESLGASGYDVIRLRLGLGEPPRPLVRAAAESGPPPVAAEAGARHITATVDAVIRLRNTPP